MLMLLKLTSMFGALLNGLRYTAPGKIRGLGGLFFYLCCMKRILAFLEYLLFRLGLLLLGRLPFSWIYRLSDAVAWFLRKVLRYRHRVVYGNLRQSFPEKPEPEIRKIVRDFYRHLSDILLESIRGMHLPREEVLRRYRFVNPELLDADFQAGRHVFVMPAHYGNWEWGVRSFPLQVKHAVVGVYKPIHNPYISRYVDACRTHFGLQLASIYTTRATLAEVPATPTLYIMMSDQSPSSTRKAHWVSFLNRDTACLHGADFYARHYNYPVYYMHIQRVRRGFYDIHLSLLCAEPARAEPEHITRAYMQALEHTLRAEPAPWLWSHRRWKRKRAKPAPEQRLPN